MAAANCNVALQHDVSYTFAIISETTPADEATFARQHRQNPELLIPEPVQAMEWVLGNNDTAIIRRKVDGEERPSNLTINVNTKKLTANAPFDVFIQMMNSILGKCFNNLRFFQRRNSSTISLMATTLPELSEEQISASFKTILKELNYSE